MDLPISRLGTTPAVTTALVKERVGWLRSRFVPHEFSYEDWTIDGEPLRDLIAWPSGDVADEVTPIGNDGAGPRLAAASLRTLLGEESGQEWDTTMPDGRVAVLFCASCFDFGCGALTTDLHVSGSWVEWRDVAWQDDNHLLDLDQESPVITLRFAREQYEPVLRELLAREEARLEQAK